MAKTKLKTSEVKVRHPLLIAGIILYIGWRMVNSGSKYMTGINQSGLIIAGYLATIFAISFYRNRHKLTRPDLLRMVLIYLATFAVLFGWKLASYSVPPLNIQIDGYTVTGGFMMLAGGFTLGYLLGRNDQRLKDGKK